MRLTPLSSFYEKDSFAALGVENGEILLLATGRGFGLLGCPFSFSTRAGSGYTNDQANNTEVVALDTHPSWFYRGYRGLLWSTESFP